MLIPWVEFYNLSSSPVSLSGWTVTSSLATVTLSTTIAAGAYLVVNLGTFSYTNGVGLYDASLNLVDALSAGAAPSSGSSLHRCPNGRGDWRSNLDPPTMGSANICQ